MKKVLFSAIAASFLLASCGPDLCECVNMDEPTEACKKMEDEWKSKYKDAEKDEKKKMREEIKACKKDEKKDEE